MIIVHLLCGFFVFPSTWAKIMECVLTILFSEGLWFVFCVLWVLEFLENFFLAFFSDLLLLLL